MQILRNYLPGSALPYVQKWSEGYTVHIKISKNRKSKLGDYLKLQNGSHRISVNSALVPGLFFFVLTHELAHLIAFETYGRGIAPHGKEWKHIYREMLLDSLGVYEPELQQIMRKYARSPKANFMASPELVRYFEFEDDNFNFLEDLSVNEQFVYRGNRFSIEKKLRKNYLCKHLRTGRKFVFNPLAKVEYDKS